MGTPLSLAAQPQGLFDRIKLLPEDRFMEGGVVLKPDAYAAFLDLRQLLEREIIPALERLEQRDEA